MARYAGCGGYYGEVCSGDFGQKTLARIVIEKWPEAGSICVCVRERGSHRHRRRLAIRFQSLAAPGVRGSQIRTQNLALRGADRGCRCLGERSPLIIVYSIARLQSQGPRITIVRVRERLAKSFFRPVPFGGSHCFLYNDDKNTYILPTEVIRILFENCEFFI